MDPITAAIVAALATGALRSVGKAGEDAVSSAYSALKGLLHRKFGGDSEVAEAVANLEARPDSKARSAVVSEALADVNASDDPELVEAAQSLIERVGATPGGRQVVQQVIGSRYVALASDAGSASVTVQQPGSSGPTDST